MRPGLQQFLDHVFSSGPSRQNEQRESVNYQHRPEIESNPLIFILPRNPGLNPFIAAAQAISRVWREYQLSPERLRAYPLGDHYTIVFYNPSTMCSKAPLTVDPEKLVEEFKQSIETFLRMIESELSMVPHSLWKGAREMLLNFDYTQGELGQLLAIPVPHGIQAEKLQEVLNASLQPLVEFANRWGLQLGIGVEEIIKLNSNLSILVLRAKFSGLFTEQLKTSLESQEEYQLWQAENREILNNLQLNGKFGIQEVDGLYVAGILIPWPPRNLEEVARIYAFITFITKSRQAQLTQVTGSPIEVFYPGNVPGFFQVPRNSKIYLLVGFPRDLDDDDSLKPDSLDMVLAVGRGGVLQLSSDLVLPDGIQYLIDSFFRSFKHFLKILKKSGIKIENLLNAFIKIGLFLAQTLGYLGFTAMLRLLFWLRNEEDIRSFVEVAFPDQKGFKEMVQELSIDGNVHAKVKVLVNTVHNSINIELSLPDGRNISKGVMLYMLALSQILGRLVAAIGPDGESAAGYLILDWPSFELNNEGTTDRLSRLAQYLMYSAVLSALSKFAHRLDGSPFWSTNNNIPGDVYFADGRVERLIINSLNTHIISGTVTFKKEFATKGFHERVELILEKFLSLLNNFGLIPRGLNLEFEVILDDNRDRFKVELNGKEVLVTPVPPK